MDSFPYQEALDYLYSFVDYSRERSDRYAAEAFDLGRMDRFLNRLGLPHARYPIIHVAGTKGKGSVAAMMASALQAGGYRVGLYTSPHLVRFTERIRVDGQEIPEEDVAALTQELRKEEPLVPGLTTFELITALGFLHFARQRVDCAVVEVGLGGRLDATNVVQPLVSVITSISFDHTHLLGTTLDAIAREKAGIIKPGIPVVIAPQPQEAERAILETAHRVGVPTVLVGKDWSYQIRQQGLDGQSIDVWPGNSKPSGAVPAEAARLFVPLLGNHQAANAATAYAALRLADRRGLPLEPESITRGFASTRWDGRFQILSRRPAVIVDAAHNRDSARRLAETLRTYFSGRTTTLVFGASVDKDITGMLSELLPTADRVVLTQAFHPRATDTDALKAKITGFGGKVASITPPSQAVAMALEGASPDEVILVCGSVFLVGEVLECWNYLAPRPVDPGAEEAPR